METAEAQRETARALHQQAVDQLKAGTTAAVDVLRARVELQTREQQVIAAQNALEKQKLALARMIGLPPAQELALTGTPPSRPAAAITLEAALRRAYSSRADYQSTLSRVRAAALTRQSARAGTYRLSPAPWTTERLAPPRRALMAP